MQIEYVKGNAYFSFLKHKIKPYAHLDKPFSCDILVIGGGIDGAITLYYLAKAGFDCALIEKHRLGLGCTSVATALLEYQLDDHAKQLKKVMSEDEIMACYTLNLNGLNLLKQFVSDHGNDCNYNERDTVLYSLQEKDLAELEEEYHFRKMRHLPVKLLTEQNNPFSFALRAGLLAENGGGGSKPLFAGKATAYGSRKTGCKDL